MFCTFGTFADKVLSGELLLFSRSASVLQASIDIHADFFFGMSQEERFVVGAVTNVATGADCRGPPQLESPGAQTATRTLHIEI